MDDAGQITVFDRALLGLRRDRAAADFAAHAVLFREVAERLADRLDDIKRRFPLALELGCRTGLMAPALGGRGGIETLLQCDISPKMARLAAADGAPALVVDDELLPFADGSIDLVLSCLGQHWINDLPGALLQIRRALKPDGLFLAALFGGETLGELRQVLIEAETEAEGGVSPRVSPFPDLRDAAGLLQRAGLALPVADRDQITMTYPDALSLMRDLRGMAESNLLRDRRKGLSRRATLLRAAALYQDRFADSQGRIPATFEILFLTAWAPDAAQPQPLRPGSATTRLADALDAEERDAGDVADPRGTPPEPE